MIGVAGWNIPSHFKNEFPEDGTHLERYARQFSAVEINTTFYKDHKPSTFEKWREVTPEDFKFSLKLNQRFSHDKAFNPNIDDLKKCLDGMKGLGEKFKVLLIQLPGSLEFSPEVEKLLQTLHQTVEASLVIEPRNVSWLQDEALALFSRYNISKVHADPEKCSQSHFGNLDYYRLHGSPIVYRSSYSMGFLRELEEKLTPESWCIFDNTTFGHGVENALALQKMTLS